MRVFDVPAGAGANDRPMRIVVHGTCRVHAPFEALVAMVRIVKVWVNGEAASFTFGDIVDEGWLIKTTGGKISRTEKLARVQRAAAEQ